MFYAQRIYSSFNKSLHFSITYKLLVVPSLFNVATTNII